MCRVFSCSFIKKFCSPDGIRSALKATGNKVKAIWAQVKLTGQELVLVGAPPIAVAAILSSLKTSPETALYASMVTLTVSASLRVLHLFHNATSIRLAANPTLH